MVKIPRSEETIGGYPSSRPPLPSAPADYGKALVSLGDALSKMSTKQSNQADRNLLIANPIEGVFDQNISKNMTVVVRDAEGGIDFGKTMEKSNFVLENEEALFEQSYQETVDYFQSLPFRDKETFNAVISGIQGHKTKQGTSEERSRAIRTIMDRISMQEIVDQSSEYKLDPSGKSLEGLLTDLMSIADGMESSGAGKETVLSQTNGFLRSASNGFSSAIEMVGGYNNEELNRLASPFMTSSIDTINKTLGLVTPDGKQTTEQYQLSSVFAPVNPAALEELNQTIQFLPEGPGRNRLIALSLSAQDKLRTNKVYLGNADLIASGSFDNADKNINQGQFDQFLYLSRLYETGNPEVTMNMIKYWLGRTQQLPKHAKDMLNRFVARAEFNTAQERTLFEYIAETNANGRLSASLNDQNQRRVQDFLSATGSFEQRTYTAPKAEFADGPLSKEEFDENYEFTKMGDLETFFVKMGHSDFDPVDSDEFVTIHTVNKYMENAYLEATARDANTIQPVGGMRGLAVKKFLEENRFIKLKNGKDKLVPIGLTESFRTVAGQEATLEDDFIVDFIRTKINENQNLQFKYPDTEERMKHVEDVLEKMIVVSNGYGQYQVYTDAGQVADFNIGNMRSQYINRDVLVSDGDLIQFKEVEFYREGQWEVRIPETATQYDLPPAAMTIYPTKEESDMISDWERFATSPLADKKMVQDFPLKRVFSAYMNSSEFTSLPVEEQVQNLLNLSRGLKGLTHTENMLVHPMMARFVRDAYVTTLGEDWMETTFEYGADGIGRAKILETAGYLYHEYVNSLSQSERKRYLKELTTIQIDPASIGQKRDPFSVAKRYELKKEVGAYGVFNEATRLQNTRMAEQGRDGSFLVMAPESLAPYLYYLDNDLEEYVENVTQMPPDDLVEVVKATSRPSGLINTVMENTGTNVTDQQALDMLRDMFSRMYPQNSLEALSLYAVPKDDFLELTWRIIRRLDASSR